MINYLMNIEKEASSISDYNTSLYTQIIFANYFCQEKTRKPLYLLQSWSPWQKGEGCNRTPSPCCSIPSHLSPDNVIF